MVTRGGEDAAADRQEAAEKKKEEEEKERAEEAALAEAARQAEEEAYTYIQIAELLTAIQEFFEYYQKIKVNTAVRRKVLQVGPGGAGRRLQVWHSSPS